VSTNVTDAVVREMILEYGEGPRRIEGISSLSRLDTELDRITAEATAAGRPCMANLISPGSRILGMGIGAERSVLSWIDEESDHPYLLSKGNLDSLEPLQFYYGNQWSEFPPFSAIDVATAREAMGEFLLTDRLPANVKWTE
jgi:Immunity protein Imm1